MFDPASPLGRLANVQAGAVSRAQLLANGGTDSQIGAQLKACRWQPIHPGVYATFTGPLPDLTRVWAAVLYAGDGAVASHRTAAWLQGIEEAFPSVVEISVPVDRRVQRQPGLVIRRCRDLSRRTHPISSLPQTRVEETVLDLIEQEERVDDVVGWITRACQRRRTTAARIDSATRSRTRMRWRPLVADVLADVRDGVLSPLERRWRRRVERAHGLPSGDCNVAEIDGLKRRYRDVRYTRWRVVVELDGRAAHSRGVGTPGPGARQQCRRDGPRSLAVRVAGSRGRPMWLCSPDRQGSSRPRLGGDHMAVRTTLRSSFEVIAEDSVAGAWIFFRNQPNQPRTAAGRYGAGGRMCRRAR